MVEDKITQARLDSDSNIDIKLDYIEMNDADSFKRLDSSAREGDVDLVILSGALVVDQTRLIDNILLGVKKDQILG